MKETLTKKQRQIFDYISQFIGNFGYAPSYREIADHFGYSSVATVAEYISILEEKNYLNKESLTARSISITANEESGIPLMGAIAAGSPIEAIRTNEFIDIPKDMIGRRTFALKVRGSSMINDGIFDGDYVIIEATHSARNGDIVVALLDNENVTLKRFYNEKGGVRLQPANSRMSPLRVAKKRVTIQGKVKGVIRKYL